jgi:tetratricopeptide (TPR) repeat protein
MSNVENIKVLADIAHQSGNYEQSYAYYSRILEEEIENALAWLRKGVAAANLTRSDKDMISEAKVLIQKSTTIGIEDSERQDAGTRLRSAYESIMKKLDDELLHKIKDYQKVGMPSGGSALIHMAGQSLNKIVSARGQAEARFKSLELLEIMCAVTNEAPSYEYSIRAIDALKAHSKAAGNYLTEGTTNTYGAQVSKLHNDMLTQLSRLPGEDKAGHGNASPGTASPSAKSTSWGLRIFQIIFWLVVLTVIISKCAR